MLIGVGDFCRLNWRPQLRRICSPRLAHVQKGIRSGGHCCFPGRVG